MSYFQGCLLKLSLDYRISEDGGDWRDDAALEIIVDGKDEGFCVPPVKLLMKLTHDAWIGP